MVMMMEQPQQQQQQHHDDNVYDDDDDEMTKIIQNNNKSSSSSFYSSSSSSSFLTPIIWCILLCETAERFAYFGFRAILVLYFTTELHYDESKAISLFAYVASLAYSSRKFVVDVVFNSFHHLPCLGGGLTIFFFK